MTTSKIAVSIPDDVLVSARRAVKRGRAPSLSAYVSSALRHQATLDELDVLLDELLAETGGPLTAAERRAADRALFGAAGPRRRRRS